MKLWLLSIQLLQNLPGNLSSDLMPSLTNLPNRLLPSEHTTALLIDLRRAKQVPQKAGSVDFFCRFSSTL